MVSIVGQESPLDLIGNIVGQGLRENLPRNIEKGYERGLLQNSIGDIAKLANNPNASDLDITLAAMKAGAGIPGSERYLGQIIPELIKNAQANRSRNIPQPGEQPGMNRDRQPMPQQQNNGQTLPQFMGGKTNPSQQTNQFFPTNQPPGAGPGNVPQEATSGIKLPLLDPRDQISEARKLQDESKRAGRPLDFKDSLELVKQSEAEKRFYNEQIDKELGQRVKAQETYGKKAVEYLTENYPEATQEMKTIFQKKGEEESRSGRSEADINRHLSKEATRFANSINNVKEDLSAPRFFNKIARGINGDYKTFDKSAEDLRGALKPLIDEGLYDTARSLLQEQNYGLEEREMIINPLSQRAQSVMNQLPKVPSKPASGIPHEMALQQRNTDIEPLKDSLRQLQEIDPNFSLVLGRKAAEDKNYDWREYKDAVNQLQQEGVEFSQDQLNQISNLNTPSLNLLGKILHGLDLIGR